MVLEEDEMLLLSLATGGVVLHLFPEFVSYFELLTAFWRHSDEEFIAVAAWPHSVVMLSVTDGGINTVPLALLFLHDSKMFLLLMASTLCFLRTLGFLSDIGCDEDLLLSLLTLVPEGNVSVSLLGLTASVSFMTSEKDDSLDPGIFGTVFPLHWFPQFPKGGDDGGDTHALPLL